MNDSPHRPFLLKLDFIELQTHSFTDLSGHQFGVLIPLHTPSEDFVGVDLKDVEGRLCVLP